jgi:hypothetical protein
MSTVKPPVMEVVVSAYRNVGRALQAMPLLAVIAFLLSLAYGIIDFTLNPVPASDAAEPTRIDPIVFVFSILWSFLMTPVLIAIHRFILLGEVTAGYAIDPRNPRFLRFFGWSLALALLISLPTFLATAFSALMGGYGAALIFALLVGCLFVILRATILFPAIAVDAPGATWSDAFTDTRGYVWRILAIGLVATLPLWLALIPVYILQDLTRASASLFTPSSLLLVALLGLVSAATSALLVAIASRLYQLIGDRVKQPSVA